MLITYRNWFIGLAIAASCLPGWATANAAEPTYAEAVLKDRPIAYYRFDETAGEAAADATGNGHDAVYKGSVVLGEKSAFPSLGASVLFGGKDGSVRIPAHKAFKFGKQDFAIEFWFNCRETLSSRGDIFTFKGQGKDFGIFKPVGNTNLLAITRPYRPFQAQTDPFSIGVWHHAVFVRQSGVDRWFVDGVSSGPTVGSEQAIDMDADILIVINHYGDLERLDSRTVWNGLIDELAIYGEALTARQIESHFKAARGPVRQEAGSQN